MSEREIRGGRGDNGQAGEKRRAQFLEDQGRQGSRRGGNNLLMLVSLAVGIGLLVVGGLMALGIGPNGKSGAAPVVSGGAVAPGSGDSVRRSSGTFTVLTPAADGSVSLPVANFQDGKAKYYSVKQNNKDIDFFVVKSSDGVVRAAIDSCDVCYQARRGYRQEGDEMVCNNCGQRFASVKINEVKGGCNPVPLDREVQGEQLIIDGSDLADGGRYF